jgi:hypothetical protein
MGIRTECQCQYPNKEAEMQILRYVPISLLTIIVGLMFNTGITLRTKFTNQGSSTTEIEDGEDTCLTLLMMFGEIKGEN